EWPTPLGQGPADTADIPGPGSGLGALEAVQRTGVGLAEVDRDELGLAVGGPTAHHDRRPINGRGHDQAAVVIRMVPQELDAAGSPAQHGRFPMEPGAERYPG